MVTEDLTQRPFSYSCEDRGTVTVLRVLGEIDLSSYRIFEGASREALRRDKPLIIDLTRVTYVDSLGMRFLFDFHTRAVIGRSAVTIVVPDGGVRRVMEIAGVALIMPLHRTLEQALHAFDGLTA